MPTCRSRWRWWPRAPPSAPRSRWTRSPSSCATPGSDGRCSPATIPRPTCAASSLGRTRRSPPARRGCSGCSGCTPARTSPRRPPHTAGRYAFHDLLRAYATDLTHATDPEQERHAATHRMLDHYLHSAYTAERLLNPTRDPLDLAPTQPGVTPEQPADHQQATSWFTAEHAVLLAAVDRAATGFDTHTWQLAWSLWTYQFGHGRLHDWDPRRSRGGGRRRAAGRPAGARARTPQARPGLHAAASPGRRGQRPAPRPRPVPSGRRHSRAGAYREQPLAAVRRAGSPRGGPRPRARGPSICTGRRVTRRGRARPSTRSAGTTPASASPSGRSTPASRPSPSSRNSTTFTGRPRRRTASATPTSNSATKPAPSRATGRPSTSPGTPVNCSTCPWP